LGAVKLIRKKVFQEILDFLNEQDDDTPYTLYLLRKKIKEELERD
jgi:hypothetical protein